MKQTKSLTKKPISAIPDFKSYAEEAQFWDTHDFTEYDLKSVRVTVAKNLSDGLTDSLK